eukprot:TRINITY_DN1934_c0_g1_i2.p1 TRINITY_DN1934_c0_g1~~TRINITY_DN1934_c0_g1_i2.p1  ORF type:complete len:280 (+),score=50.01 TRINITY_DN1934_c0_g1_i2:416-1255(+)
MQSLYHSSEKMFVSLIQFLPANDMLFRGLNQLWVPSLMKHGEFLYYGPCTKWIISEDDLNTRRLTQNQTRDTVMFQEVDLASLRRDPTVTLEESYPISLASMGSLIRPRIFPSVMAQNLDRVQSVEGFVEEKGFLGRDETNKITIWIHLWGKNACNVHLTSEKLLQESAHQWIRDDQGRVKEVIFSDSKMQSLYHSSEKMFVSLIQFLPANDMLFRGLNQLWVPSLMKHGEFLYYGPCTKWIISEDDLNTRRLTQNQTFDPSLLGLHWDVLKDSDVQTV